MPIRELSRRIGVSTDLLRKWEHRYAVFSPERTSGNQRLYSQVDEARARLMLRHVRSGMSPAQAAELATAARFRIKPDPAVRSPAATDSTTNTRMTMQTALEHYDETTAEQALEKLLTMLPATAVIRDVLLPYLRDIGNAGPMLTSRLPKSTSPATSSTAACSASLAGGIADWVRAPCLPAPPTSSTPSA